MEDNVKERLTELKDFLIFSKVIKNQQELADILGVNKGNLSALLNGKRPISEYFVIKLGSKFPQINIDYILNGEGTLFSKDEPQPKSNLAEIEDLDEPPLPKIVDKEEEGNIKYFYDVQASASNLEFYSDDLAAFYDYNLLKIQGFGNDCVAFTVTGDSMYPTAKEKDIVVFKPLEVYDIINGEIYIVISRDGQRMIKRLVLDEKKKKIKCISDNEDKHLYPTFTIDPDRVLKIYRVLGFVSITYL